MLPLLKGYNVYIAYIQGIFLITKRPSIYAFDILINAKINQHLDVDFVGTWYLQNNIVHHACRLSYNPELNKESLKSRLSTRGHWFCRNPHPSSCS